MIIIADIGSQICLYIDFTDFFNKASSDGFPHFQCASKEVSLQKLVAYSYILVEMYQLFPNRMIFFVIYRLPK